MLCRNIDTKSGLVNGVMCITSQHVTVQFDHISQPYNIEMVKNKFMVMKNYYVYSKQFPLFLAYAITIHKCQPEPKKPTTCIKNLKRALSTFNVDCDSLAKKSLSHYGNGYNPRDEQVWPFKFYSVDEQWQHNACSTLGLQYVVSNRLRPGGPKCRSETSKQAKTFWLCQFCYLQCMRAYSTFLTRNFNKVQNN